MVMIKNPFRHLDIDPSWTLFLDRDGVINVDKPDHYVLDRHQFIFKEGALEALFRLSQLFGKIIVVTNQRGVDKGVMTEADLEDIHEYMKSKIECIGGRIDDIFYCTSLQDDHPDRKPNTGMALKAKVKYPEIDFSKSIMVGDKPIDLQWGRKIGAVTVWISSDRFAGTVDQHDMDADCESLFELAHLLQVKI